MLASGDEVSHSGNDCSDNTTDHSQHLIAAESQLMATRLALEGERNEVARLNLQIKLLEKEHTLQKREIDDMKKTMNKQKSDIKRLTKDNNSLRREISRYNGMRKYTGDTHGDIVDNSNKLVADVSNAHNEFRDKITGITSLLVDALDSCSDKNSDFITVTAEENPHPMPLRHTARWCHLVLLCRLLVASLPVSRCPNL